MMEKHARGLRDACLFIALVIFALGIVDVLLLGFDMSLHTGLITKMGMQPHSFVQAAVVLLLASISFGVVDMSRTR